MLVNQFDMGGHFYNAYKYWSINLESKMIRNKQKKKKIAVIRETFQFFFLILFQFYFNLIFMFREMEEHFLLCQISKETEFFLP